MNSHPSIKLSNNLTLTQLSCSFDRDFKTAEMNYFLLEKKDCLEKKQSMVTLSFSFKDVTLCPGTQFC